MQTLREIFIPVDDILPTSLAFDQSARHFFIGSEKGSICTLNNDPSNTFKELHAHQHSIKKVKPPVDSLTKRKSLSKIFLPFNDDLLISLGEDGTILFYSFTANEEKNQSKEIFRDELLINENVLKEKVRSFLLSDERSKCCSQTRELNDLIESQGVMERNAERMFEEKTNESSKEFAQFDLHCQSELRSVQQRLVQLEQSNLHQTNEEENQLNQLIEQKERHAEEFNEERKQSLGKLRRKMTEMSLDRTEDPVRSNRDVRSIHLSYRHQLDRMEERFAHLFTRSHSSIDLDWEDFQPELTELTETFEQQRRILLDQIERLENEEILLRFRVRCSV